MGMNVGVAFTSNGAAPVLVHDGKPSHYDFGFETSDGLGITVRINTENESRAETIRNDLEEQMGWTSVAIEKPVTPGSIIGSAFATAIIGPFVIFVLAIIIGTVYNMADFKTPEMFTAYGSYISFCVRLALYMIPACFGFGLLTGYADYKNYQKKQQNAGISG